MCSNLLTLIWDLVLGKEWNKASNSEELMLTIYLSRLKTFSGTILLVAITLSSSF